MYTKTFTAMKEPKVELKNIKTFRGMEGIGFNLDLYINGVKCMFVINDANGGMYSYEHNIDSKNPELIKTNIELLDDYINLLPPKVFDIEGEKHILRYDFDMYIDEKLEEWEKQKEIKKQLKLQTTSILIGVPNDNKYSYFNFKRPLSELSIGKLRQSILEIQTKHCKDGVVILNTNLEALGIKI